jgi:hypothetical protein
LKIQLFSDVILEEVIHKVTQEALLQDDGKPILTTHSVLGVSFSSLKVDQIRMRLWSRISDKCNDLANNELYQVFDLVQDEQIAEFAKIINITKYMKFDWIKATAWFKAIVTE